MTGKHLSRACKVIKENLPGTNTCLTSFNFRHGANFYVFSYEKSGKTRYTFIDAGDYRYRDQVLSILEENDINPADIETVIITHRHYDHCGLADMWAARSDARFLVHSNFKNFVEGELNPEERRWMGDFDPSLLKACNFVYLPQSTGRKPTNIFGLDFPSLTEPFEIGDGGKLEILACPESSLTHSPDQIIALYSPVDNPYPQNKRQNGFFPTDDILFSGDLWLMKGPLYEQSLSNLSRRLRFGFQRIAGRLPDNVRFRRNAQEQDAGAKEALKQGFHLIRVMPGHNEEFIGSKIIPDSLLANRDLLMKLGYPAGEDISTLKSSHLLPRIAEIREKAYSDFTEELKFWFESGYTTSDMADILVRLYKEQSGGNKLVRQDRKERRLRLKETLTRLKNDNTYPDDFRQLSKITLSELPQI